MEHDAAVADRPVARTLRGLLADEAVFDAQAVVRIGLRVEQVTEARLESVRVAVVTHLQQTVLDAKCLSVVVAQLVTRELWCPAGEVAAVEQLNPVLVLRAGYTGGEEQHAAKDRCTHVLIE